MTACVGPVALAVPGAARNRLMPSGSRRALVLFAHGARAATWAVPFERLRDLMSARLPEVPVRLAFLELMQPDLPLVCHQLAAEGITRIELFPIFLAVGGHLREDLPELVAAARARDPQLEIVVHPALGESEVLLQAIADGIYSGVAAAP